MTVSTKAIENSRIIPVDNHRFVFVLNLILTCLIFVGIAGYIFLSNHISARRYQLVILKKQFNQISASASIEKEQLNYNLEELMDFARLTGMVEAKDTITVLEESGVALSE